MKWKVEKSKYLINDRWIKVRADRCITPDNKVVEPYYVLEYPNWVNIVAITKSEEIILVKTYRHGIREELLELPCGLIDKTDASPLEAAKRELLEETGFTSDSFIQTGVVSANPANHNNLTYCFLARDLIKIKSQSLDETEDVEVVLTPLDKVFKMLKEGKFLQALHVSSLFYSMNHLNPHYAFEF